MNLLENFEYTMYYRIFGHISSHRQDNARTGLLLFLTDEIRNMISYNEVNTPIDLDLPEWISVDRNLFDGLYRLECALRAIPDLTNDYIRGNYSNENKGFVKTMLDICESDIFPAFSVLNNFNVTEVQEINNIINQLHQYNKWFEAYDIINIDDLMDKLYTTTFDCIKSVLDTIGFGKIAIIYKEILTHTGKERNYYVTDSPIILLNNAVNSVMANLKDPDKERVDAIKKIFREFITGEVDTQKLSDIYKSLVQQPTLSGILAYESLIRPFGVIMHADPDYDYKLERAVTTLGNVASLIDYQGQPDIIKRLDDAVAIEDKNKCVDKILEIYDDIASRFKEMDFRVIVELILAFYYNLLISSRYIPIVPSITEADDMRRVPVIDRQGVLKAIATYDIHDIEIMPFLPKGDNAYNQAEQYLITFLGDYGIYASDQIFMHKIDNFIDQGVQSILSYQRAYAEDYDEIPLFASVEDKILANMPEDAANAEVAFLQAASLAWNNPETTDEEREVIERLIPPMIYINFVNNAAFNKRDDIVKASLKRPTAKELCVVAPDKWQAPDQVTDQDIDEYLTDIVKYLEEHAYTMNYANSIGTYAFANQYIMVGITLSIIQSLNKFFEGRGKFSIYVNPRSDNIHRGLDVVIPFVVRLDGGYVAMGTFSFDCKSD